MKEKIVAIVISEDHYNALGMVRSLGQSNIPVILLLTTVKKTFVEHSKYVSKTIKILREQEKIICELKHIISDLQQYVVFPLSDFAAEAVDQVWNELGTNVVCPHMKVNLPLYLNQENAKQLAFKCGLNVPTGKVIELDKIENEWEIYPSIVKPLVSIEGKKGDITTVHSKRELKECVNELRSKGYKRVLLERFISGTDEHMIEVMGYSTPSEVQVCGIISKVREYPIQNGSTSYAKIVKEHKGLSLDHVKKFIKETGFYGLFDIEFKFEGDTAWFIECNFRNGAPGYALSQRENNIPVGWINSMLNVEIPNGVQIVNKDYFMCEQTDILNMLKGKVKFITWIKEYRRAAKIFGNHKDWKPVCIYYYRFMQIALRKAGLRGARNND